MKVYCVIVTFNGLSWIDKCLTSIYREEIPPSIVVVDNCSTDATVEFIRSKYPDIEVIVTPENIGFGRGNNLGIRKAIERRADYVFLLNQDAYLIPGCVKVLVKALEAEPKAGLVSPIHLAGDGRNLDFLFYKYVHPNSTPFLIGDVLQGKNQNIYEAEFVNAAAWMLRGSLIKEIGLFHPSFDHYGEDREYVARLQRSGYKVLICSNCWILHDRPQHRKKNSYHDYCGGITRNLLQGLIENRLTYFDVTRKMLQLFFLSILKLRFRDTSSVIKNWLWILKKRKKLRVYEKI